MLAEKMVKFYFGQSEHYLSNSKGDLVRISEMHPVHAANAAKRLLADSHIWGDDAGRSGIGSHAQWMLGTPLWNALHRRANEIPPFIKVDANTWKQIPF